MIYYIDLFSGAGGTTTGIHLAGSKVVACVNHDAKAISSHKANQKKFIGNAVEVNIAKAIAETTQKSVNEYLFNTKLQIE